MTPYSLNPPEGPSLQGQTQLFISPNNQECPTFLNIFDPRQNIEIGGSLTENYQQDELHDGSSSNCNSSSLISPEPVQEVMDVDPCDEERYKIEEERKTDSTINIHGCEGNKWMSSKMRLMKKMMRPSVSPTSDKMAINSSPRFQNQGLQTCKYSQRSPRNNGSATTRVCSDCNTSTTPLWRSGPKGPKSLCNACGIRQRKARRAMAEAANGLVTPINNVAAACAKTRVHNKEKKSRTNHFAQFKNKYKSATTTTITTTSTDSSESHVRKLDYLKDFAISLRSANSDFEQVMFPRDEVAEAALLLMDLSCGFLSSYN